MKNEALKNILLNNLEEFGREKIEDCIRASVYSDDDVNLVFLKNDEKLILFNEEQMNNNDCIFLYNFGNSQGKWVYKESHYDFLESGETKTEDFEKWFNNECCLDSEVETIYEIIENKINEIC